MFKILILLSFGAAFCEAQVFGFGPCPQVSVKQDFVVSRYVGKWYEAEKYFAIFELGGKCITATYTPKNDGTVQVYNTQINVLTNNPRSISGTARLTGGPTEGKLGVTFPSTPFSPADAPYWVLETDYDNYSVVYSCTSFGFIKTEFAWILTRQNIPTASVMSTAYSVFDRNGIRKNILLKTDHKNCPASY